RAATGTPIRRIERAKRPFAEAEPEPLTFANLTTKSLTRESRFTRVSIGARRSVGRGEAVLGRTLGAPARTIVGVRHFEQELLHVPRTGRAALGAEPAVQAHVLVLHHDTAGAHGRRDVKRLRETVRGRGEPRAQLALAAVRRERDAIRRADVDA